MVKIAYPCETCNDIYESPNRERFQSITNSYDLKVFLVEMAKKHHYFYHYTTLSALEKIIKSNKWKFASARKTNDLHECFFKGGIDEWSYIYSCSFSHGDEDNVGMWKMYGDNNQSVCVRINNSGILSWLKYLEEKEVFFYKTKLLSKEESFFTAKFETISIQDIAYIHGWQDAGCSQICWGNIINSTSWAKNISAERELTGFIKNSAWEYEKETRIMISLHRPEGDGQNVERPEEIYIDANALFSGIETITFSPFMTEMSDNLFNKVEQIKKALSEKGIEVKFYENYFKGKINIKS